MTGCWLLSITIDLVRDVLIQRKSLIESALSNVGGFEVTCKEVVVMGGLTDIVMISLANLIFIFWIECTLKIIFSEIYYVGENWIYLAENRIRWPAFVNVVMNLQIP
jgi:hypothetical protein